MNWDIKVAKSWSSSGLTPLVNHERQLHGVSFSGDKLEIYLKYVDHPLPLAKRMLFEILGQFFFCEGLNLIELKNDKFVLQAKVITKWHK